MKKKISAILVVVVLFFALSPPQVYAQSVESIHYDDGSYILIEKECSSQKTKALGSKSGSKQYKYYSAADELQWIVTLSADFTFKVQRHHAHMFGSQKLRFMLGSGLQFQNLHPKLGM